MNKEINLISLCVFLPKQGDEVPDRYNPFCLFPFVNLKQGGLTLCVAVTVWFLDLSFGGPQVQHPALQLIHRRKRWLTGTTGVTAVTIAFWLFMWAQVVACGQFPFFLAWVQRDITWVLPALHTNINWFNYIGHQFYCAEQNPMSSKNQQDVPGLFSSSFSPRVLVESTRG